MKRKPDPLWWEVFISEYIQNGQNAKRAYMKAKPNVKERTAEVDSEKLLRKAEFLAKLKAAQSKASEEIEMPRLRWFRLLADIAEFDLPSYLTEDGEGNTRLVSDWKGKENRHVLETVEIQTHKRYSKDGDLLGETQNCNIRAASKLKALEMIGKALGYLKEEVKLSGAEDLAAAIVAARRRANKA
jgi:hypothetical protein